MKNLIFILLLAFSATTFAQTGIGTTTPNASAQLDVSSTTKGFLPPRMTTAQRNAIVAPAEGLTVYCTTDDRIYTYTGSAWQGYVRQADNITANLANVRKGTATYNNDVALVYMPNSTDQSLVMFAASDPSFSTAFGIWSFHRAGNIIVCKRGDTGANVSMSNNETWYTIGGYGFTAKVLTNYYVIFKLTDSRISVNYSVIY